MMGYEDVVIVVEFIECDMIIGCYFDIFGYIKIDYEVVKKVFVDKGKVLILLFIGEEVYV